MLNEVVLLSEAQCHTCGKELTVAEVDAFESRTDGAGAFDVYCAAHIASRFALCLECCGVYTANPSGICRYCLEQMEP